MKTSEFLEVMYPDAAEGWVTLWRNDTKNTSWLPVDRIAEADEIAERCKATSKANLFYGVCLRREETNGRGRKDDCIAMPGLWMDIDYAEMSGRKNSGKNYPPKEIAHLALEEMPYQPTLTVATGGGVHAYWLFHELFDMRESAARAYGERLSTAWIQVYREKLKAHGEYEVDSTGDLTRVLRPPGTWNWRHGLPVDVEVHNEGLRYSPDDFDEWCDRKAIEVAPVEYEVGDVELGDRPVPGKILALIENSPDFRSAWNHSRKIGDGSMSSYDLSIVYYASMANWTDQELADLIIAHHDKHGGKEGKCQRQDYVKNTIAKARGERGMSEALARLNDSPDADPLPEEPEERREAILKETSAVIGIQIKDWVRHGTENSIYSLVLANRKTIRVGTSAELLNGCKKMQSVLLDACDYLMKPIAKGPWMGLIKKLTSIATGIDVVGATELEMLQDQLASYLANTSVWDQDRWEMGFDRREPFVRGGALHLHQPTAQNRIWALTGHRWSRVAVCRGLSLIGFTDLQVWRIDEEGGSKRNIRFYACPVDNLPQEVKEASERSSRKV